MAKKNKVEVELTGFVRHNGKRLEPGKVVALSGPEASHLVASGAATYVEAEVTSDTENGEPDGQSEGDLDGESSGS